MNLKQSQAFMAEAATLLKNTKTNCPPAVEKKIDAFLDAPKTYSEEELEKAKELLIQAQKNAGMFNKGYIAQFLDKAEGKQFNEAEYHFERMPGDQ